MINKWLNVFLIFLVSIITLWFLCPAVADSPAADGHFPSKEQEENGTTLPITPSSTPYKPLYNYYAITENKPDFKLSMHVLEVDLSNPLVQVKPVTSHNTLFGYAFLSDMNRKWGAKASVNGGFSHTNGLLGGMYAIDGKLLIPATGQYPVLFKDGEKAFIEDAKTHIWLEGEARLESIYYNQYPQGEGLFVFTPSYGSENRIRTVHLNAVVSRGEVQGLVSSGDSFEIPGDGFLVSAIGDYAEKRLEDSVKPGMKLEIAHETITDKGPVPDYDWAYECGSWIIKNGEIVVPDSDTWVGSLNIRTPRTAVGIKDDGKLVFAVADGRQKCLSDGLTGRELAQRLLELGIKDAAFLDGGASTEMIVEGRIVNSPSAGRERMLASCFVILEAE